MQSHPDSQLYKNWNYYIQPSEDDSAGNEDILNIQAPEDLTVCDPACGSGHMLTYAFDLLYEIYEEEGYAPSDIPGLILKHNLYGMEIDERAASLAAFALTMKLAPVPVDSSRGRWSRIFSALCRLRSRKTKSPS